MFAGCKVLVAGDDEVLDVEVCVSVLDLKICSSGIRDNDIEN
jgi:hypothetical protein